MVKHPTNRDEFLARMRELVDERPSPAQVVMSEQGRQTLHEEWGAPPGEKPAGTLIAYAGMEVIVSPYLSGWEVLAFPHRLL